MAISNVTPEFYEGTGRATVEMMKLLGVLVTI
jgi:hypothetical protein